MRPDRPLLHAWPTLALALVASVLAVALPVAQELAHGSFGHGEAHGAEHGPADHSQDGHAECDAWSAATDRHQDHSDLQFELAESSSHQHHGLCTGHSSLTGRAEASSTLGGADLSTSALVGQAASVRHRSSAQPPSRGPPAVV